MTENQFDEFFRKKLEDHSSKVPEDMWQRIKQKKDKDRTVLILLLLLFVVIGGATSYFVINDRGTANDKLALSQKHKNKNAESETPINQNKKQEVIHSQNDTTNSVDKKNPTINNVVAVNGLNSRENDTKRKLNKNDLNNLTKEDKNEVEPNKSDISNLSQANISAHNSDSSRNDFSDQQEKSNEEAAITKQDQKKSMLQSDSARETKKRSEVTKIKNNNQSSIINNIFFEAFASPDIPVSRTSGNSDYLQHKDSTSKMQLSYTFGVRIGALFGEHFTVKTGLQYSEVNEKFNYEQKNMTRTVPVVVQRNLPDANGIERIVLDTSTLIQVGSQYKLNYNHYKSYDVPILVGYQTSGERLKASFNTGIILNIKTTYKGEMIDSSLNAVDINSNNFYKSNTGVSMYFGLGLSTKLNNNFQLFTEPYLKYRLGNMTGPYQQFSQKINVGGLSLGLRYNF